MERNKGNFVILTVLLAFVISTSVVTNALTTYGWQFATVTAKATCMEGDTPRTVERSLAKPGNWEDEYFGCYAKEFEQEQTTCILARWDDFVSEEYDEKRDWCYN